jgi:hypothetical protein
MRMRSREPLGHVQIATILRIDAIGPRHVVATRNRQSRRYIERRAQVCSIEFGSMAARTPCMQQFCFSCFFFS